MKAIKGNFDATNHNFDLWMGESDVNNLIPEMIDNLKKIKKYQLIMVHMFLI